MSIEYDFLLDYPNKRIYYDDSTGSTTYTVNELYSYLMDTLDELDQMDDPIPMTAQTPVEYTLTNGWFISDEDVKYLYQGAIQTSGWTHPTATDGIRVLQFAASGFVNFEATDIGNLVTGGTTGDTGILLAYNNTLRKAWIRCQAADDLFDDNDEAITVADSTSGGNLSMLSTTGECLWANVYTLGTIESSPSPQVYIHQHTDSLSEWWSSGHMDALVKVKESGTEIAEGVVTVYARQYADLYDHFQIDLSAGGRNAVPLATSTDLNNDTGSDYLLYDNEQTTITANSLIYGATSGARAEVLAVTDWGSTGALQLGNIVGTFEDDEEIHLNSITGTYLADVNGTIGSGLVLYDNEQNGPLTVGNTATGDEQSYTGVIRGLQDDGSDGKIVVSAPTGAWIDDETLTEGACTVDVNGDPTYIVDAYNDFDDVTITWVSGTLGFDAGTDEILAGETLTGGTSSATAVVLYVDVTAGTWATNDAEGDLTLGNVSGVFQDDETITSSGSGSATVNELWGLTFAHTMQKNYQQQSSYNYDVIVDCGTRTLAEVYEYLKYVNQEDSAFQTYGYSGRRVLKFAAAGYVSAVDDDIGKTVVDSTTGDTGILVSYDNSARTWVVKMTDSADIFDLASGITITTGTGAGTTEGCSYVDPVDGEHYTTAYYGYALTKASPFGTFAGGRLFGAQGVWFENMDTNDAQNLQVIDSGGTTRYPPNFQAVTVGGVEIGDRVSVFRTTGDNYIVNKSMYGIKASQNQGEAYVDVDASIEQDTPSDGIVRVVRRDAGGLILGEDRYTYTSWSGDRFTISGVTSYAYDTDDTVYVPYIDEQATSDTVSVTIIYSDDRFVMARVRNYGGAGNSILPYQAKGKLESTGFSATAQRNEDTIVN